MSLRLFDSSRGIECQFFADGRNVRWEGLEAFAKAFDPQAAGGPSMVVPSDLSTLQSLPNIALTVLSSE